MVNIIVQQQIPLGQVLHLWSSTLLFQVSQIICAYGVNQPVKLVILFQVEMRIYINFVLRNGVLINFVSFHGMRSNVLNCFNNLLRYNKITFQYTLSSAQHHDIT